MSIISGSYGSSSVSTSTSSSSSSTYTSAPDPNSLSSTAASTSRITGLSGFDVDGTVAKLMVPYQQKIDTVKQKEQVLQWQQTAYRNIISQVQNFSSNFFDITKPNYILSQNAFSSMTVTNSDTTGSVTAIANSSAQPGNYNISATLATKAQTTESALAISRIQVPGGTTSNWNGATINFKVITPPPASSTSTPSITLDPTAFADVPSLVNDINKQITTSSLNGQVSASYVNTGGKDYIVFNNTGSNTVTLTSDTADGTTNLAITPPADSSTVLTNIPGGSGLNTNLSFSIAYNGGTAIPISIDNTSGTKTIGDVISAINSATGGAVTASFDQATCKFSIQTQSTGSNSSLNLIDTSGLLSKLGITSSFNTNIPGTDATVTIKSPNDTAGTTMTEHSNNFTLNGVSYSLNNTTAAGGVNFAVSTNPQNVVNLVQNFVTQYNSLISSIETQYNAQSQQYKYPPLTSTQMKSMTQQDITNWNNQAQIGIIANDTTIGSMLNNLSNALFNPADQSTFGINLSAIGISMNPDPTNNPGQLVVDTTALTQAVQNNPQQVMNLLIQQSSATGTTIYDPSMSSANRQIRNQNEGVLQRISDIFNDNTTSLLNTQGNPGLLLQIAGFPNTASVGNNTITSQINDLNTQISTMTTDMNNQQNNYYQQFSAMESALMQMNNQSNWLTQQLSG